VSLVTFNREKFKALVQYVCYRCVDPSKLGATKLNKILWFADVLHFVEYGKPITGETYVKRQFGPAPRHVLNVLDELQQENKLVIREREFTYDVRMFMAREKPDISAFTPEQVSLVDWVMEQICDRHTATSISEATHDVIWKLAEVGEEIPYEAMLAAELGEVTEADVRWAQEAVGNAG
jgi:uncharacterized phage-associated protein